MTARTFRCAILVVVLFSFTATLPAQSVSLPTYTQARNRAIIWTVLGILGVGMTIAGWERTTAEDSYAASSGEILFDSMLFGSGLMLATFALLQGPPNYMIMNQTRPAPPSAPPQPPQHRTPGTQQQDSPPSQDQLPRDIRQLVRRPYREVRQFFAEGILDAGSQDVFGTPLVFSAAFHNDDPAVYRLFVEAGTPVDVRDQNNRNLLHVITGRRMAEEISWLMEQGVSPLQADNLGRTPLSMALADLKPMADAERWALVEPILTAMASHRNTDPFASFEEERSELDREELERLIWHEVLNADGTQQLAADLIAAGVHLYLPYRLRRDPWRPLEDRIIDHRYPVELVLAVIDSDRAYQILDSRQRDVVVRMMRAGYTPADLKTVLDHLGGTLPPRGSSGETLLHLLAALTPEEPQQFVQFLLDAGTPLEARTENGYTALHTAADNDNAPVLQALLNAGADVAARERNQQTPLHRAARHSTDGTTIDLLLEHGASITAADSDGWHPLHTAAFRGNVVALEHLLAAGAPLDATSTRGRQPYHLSTTPQAVQFFQDAGVDPAMQDDSGATILHNAMRSYIEPEFVRYLLDLGLDPNHQDHRGATPLFLAAVLDVDPLVGLLLLEYGADPAVATDSGFTPWDMIQHSERLKNTDFYWALSDWSHSSSSFGTPPEDSHELE